RSVMCAFDFVGGAPHRVSPIRAVSPAWGAGLYSISGRGHGAGRSGTKERRRLLTTDIESSVESLDHPVDNAPVRTLQHKDLTIEGYSRAAVQSYWRVPELKLGFDLGAQPWSFMTTPTWFVTHTHLDHIAALPVLVARRRMMKMAPAGLDAFPETYRAQILILEMTFVAPNERPALIHKFGHTHLDDLMARADRFENEVIIASHFSTRLHPDQIQRIVEKRLPDSLK